MSALLKLEIVRGSESWDFSDMIDWSPATLAGFGLPPIHRLNLRGPMQHGDSDVGFRLDPVFMQITTNMDATSLANQYALRAIMLEAFKPSDDPLILRVTLPDASVRCRDVFTVGGLTFDSEQFGGFFGTIPVQLKASDPTWYDPVLLTEGWAVAGVGTGMPIPLTIPWTIGSSIIDQTKVITNTGDWQSYPILRITGPITNCVITNLTVDNDKLDFTGITIAAGNYYEIDCRYGYKTVKNAAGANKIAELTNDSDLATFRIEATPKALNNENVLRVQGSAATGATRVAITYTPRFIGI